MEKRIELKELYPCDYNPRKIGKAEMDRLIDSLKTHSYAAGGTDTDIRLATTITVNKQSNRIVGGHQRVNALKKMGITSISQSNITWIDLPPDSAKEKALNISLNNREAEGIFEGLNIVLEDIAGEDEDLFADLDFGILYDDGNEITSSHEGEVSFMDTALQLEPAREYIVVMCSRGDKGEVEFSELREILNLGMVRRGGYVRGSNTDQPGVQRVIKAADILAIIKKERESCK